MARRRVVLFGATGTMGRHTLAELCSRRDGGEQLDLVIMLRETHRSDADAYAVRGVEVVWGDLRRPADVRRAVRGCDIVLNAAAMISPAADLDPDGARAINVDGVANIVAAIEAEPDGAERILFAHTSTLALTGNRPPGLHWGRVGDPLNPSIYDIYSLSKAAGERIVLESAIRHVAVLRMSFIMPVDFRSLMALRDPVMFHLPLDTHMEPISSPDAGRSLAAVVGVDPDNAPADGADLATPAFWGGVHHITGGAGMRTTAWAYTDIALELVGLGGVRDVAERRWFATRNFHLHWCFDADVAEGWLAFRRDDMASYLDALRASMPTWARAARRSMRIAPLRSVARASTRRVLRRMTDQAPFGTQWWVENGTAAYVDAFYGGIEHYRAIPDWDVALAPDGPAVRLSHGYDEDVQVWGEAELRDAANFRGGTCDASGWNGDVRQPVAWTCARGHTFHARPATVLGAGHWCVSCLGPPWRPAAEARINPFFAQVWPYGDGVGTRAEYFEQDVRDLLARSA